jgi:hypothetical protein
MKFSKDHYLCISIVTMYFCVHCFDCYKNSSNVCLLLPQKYATQYQATNFPNTVKVGLDSLSVWNNYEIVPNFMIDTSRCYLLKLTDYVITLECQFINLGCLYCLQKSRKFVDT